MSNLLGNVRKAVQDYNMISEGDKIAVGLSGGKDSLALLHLLANLKMFYPNSFDILAITIDAGFDNFDTAYLKNICDNLNVEYIVYPSHIKEIVFDIRQEKNPCSLCANLRRGMLNSVAVENGCNKVALGHHCDDVMETLLLSLFYEGHIHTFSPVTYLSRANIHLIRPMIYIEEHDIEKWIRKNNLTPISKCCIIDGHTKREDMKNLIKSFSKDIPYIKSNIFGAIKRSSINGWEKDNLNKRNEVQNEK